MSSTTTQPTSHPLARPASPIAEIPSPAKVKRGRAPSRARPVFVVAQITDDSGNTVAFSKKNLKILAVEVSAERVLDITESGEFANSFYIRVLVPARQAQRPGQAAPDGQVNSLSPAA